MGNTLNGIKRVKNKEIGSYAGLLSIGVLFLFVTVVGCQTSDKKESGENDFTSIFDGKTLNGWKGDSTYWRVEDGNLVGEVTPSTILDHNTFIIWQGDVPSDFELKVEFRITSGGNSGINYRSNMVEGVPYALKGYQADLDGAKRYTGSNYEERIRTTLASQGEKTILPPVENADSLNTYVKHNRWTAAVVEDTLGNPDSLKAQIKDGDWNQYDIIVRGNHMQHYVNGALMSDVTDNDTVNRRFDGLLGVQVHVGPPMKVEYRNFQLRALD